MLPAPHRLTRGADIRRVVRTGARSGSPLLVVHLLRSPGGGAGPGDAVAPARLAFVVGRSVGNSVVRHRVQRRLRHACRERLSALPEGSEIVVRALPASAAASYQELGAALDRCLQRALQQGQGTVS